MLLKICSKLIARKIIKKINIFSFVTSLFIERNKRLFLKISTPSLFIKNSLWAAKPHYY
jgi:hypothetical protein